jgi:hypothetical protein
VQQDLFYCGRFLDKSYDPHRSCALGTFQGIDFVYQLYQGRPCHPAFPDKWGIPFSLSCNRNGLFIIP